eukprot:359301-Chlamydomonas_euryale.AAC.3
MRGCAAPGREEVVWQCVIEVWRMSSEARGSYQAGCMRLLQHACPPPAPHPFTQVSQHSPSSSLPFSPPSSPLLSSSLPFSPFLSSCPPPTCPPLAPLPPILLFPPAFHPFPAPTPAAHMQLLQRAVRLPFAVS